MVTAVDFLDLLCERAIGEKDKYLGAGHNGPYHDPETFVRNFSHWLITFSKSYYYTKNTKYREMVYEIAQQLIAKESRPYGFSFYARNKQAKDKCNGLIGQAWAFEALAEASSCLEDKKYIEIAQEVFDLHRFDDKQGLWHRLEIDGTELPVDGTFNHQLWFAAAALKIFMVKDDRINNKISTFLDCLPFNLTILDSGLIYHPIERVALTQTSELKKTLTYYLKWPIKKILQFVKQNVPAFDLYQKAMIKKSIGYHSFNMYAFGMIKPYLKNHPFWESLAFKKSIAYMLSDEYQSDLNSNMFAYPYNPPGFEIPFALANLSSLSNESLLQKSQFWVSEQFARCFNQATFMMDKNTEDPLTHTARVYQLAMIPGFILNDISIEL